MRTIEQIKKEATDAFSRNPDIIAAYKLDAAKNFEEQFSKVSIESILFYVFAFCAYTLEFIFDTHAKEIEGYVSEMKPHSLRWYRNKTLAFLYGLDLVDESDRYDVTDINDSEQAKMRICKYCAVSEAKDASKLYIKVAGEENGKRNVLNPAQELALKSYLQQIKDAGVYIELINRAADNIRISLQIYYNPLVLNPTGSRVDGSMEQPVKDAILSYIENLSFNGEFRNASLVDVLQSVAGVEIPELLLSESKYGEYPFKKIDALIKPDAGYFAIKDTDLTIQYIPYNVSDL